MYRLGLQECSVLLSQDICTVRGHTAQSNSFLEIAVVVTQNKWFFAKKSDQDKHWDIVQWLQHWFEWKGVKFYWDRNSLLSNTFTRLNSADGVIFKVVSSPPQS